MRLQDKEFDGAGAGVSGSLLGISARLRPRWRVWLASVVLMVGVTFSARLSAANRGSPPNGGGPPKVDVTASSTGDPLSLPAKQWAEDAAANEIKVIQYGKPFLRYRLHRVDLKGDQLRDVIESRDGPVARLILRDNRPLTPDEDKAERERLQDMIDSPAAYAKHVKTDAGEKKTGIDMIKLLPVAMIYTYAPGQPQRAGHGASAEDAPDVVIDYKPDPAWVPPTLFADALTGIQGRLWIDARTHYLVRMEGAIFRPVNFGFGFFAHLFPGGTVSLDQNRANDQRWIFSHFEQHLVVRALMVKTIKQDSDVSSRDYAPIAEMSYQDAIHMLLATPLPVH